MSKPGLSYGYELQFRLKCAEGRGTEFQDFFNNLMERRDPGFRRVRPYSPPTKYPKTLDDLRVCGTALKSMLLLR